MGPRPNGRGKPPPRQAGAIHVQASMGPRPNGRGKELPPVQPPPADPASMGPRPNGRGKSAAACIRGDKVGRQ